MKKTLFLSLALASCALSATETRLLNGVTTESGWFDVSKYLVRDPEGGINDSQTCAAVTASNMLAYWYSQHPEAAKDAVGADTIYDRIFDYTKNASTTISADCNFYASAYNHASAEAVCTTATYVPTDLGYKVDVTPAGHALTGSLYTSMSVQEAITWGLQNNLAMGLTMNQTPGKGAHALTIWGGTYESYGVGDPERLTGIYYTNSDNGEELNYATFSSAPNADGETEYFFNDGTNRRWKMVEITFLLDPYATAPENPDNNKVFLGKGVTVGDYTLGGKHADATSFWLNANATLNIGEGMELASSRVRTEVPTAGFTAELTGKGTYIAEDFKMGLAKLGKDWSGTVRLTGEAGSLGVGMLNEAAVKGSVAELSAATASDWKEGGTVTADLRLTNNSLGAAGLSITELSGEKNITFAGAVSGTGDMRLADEKGGAKMSYAFEGDVKDWTGSLRSGLSKESELNVTFKNNKEVNANVENIGAGKVSVAFEKNTVVNGNLLNLDKGTMSVTAADGTSFNGNLVVDTLVLNGQVTITDFGTAQSRSLPSGVTDTEHFKVQEIIFNSGSSLTFSGDFDLSNVSVTLSQSYLDTLTTGSPVTLISAATGSTLSGFATLTNAPSGYELAVENGNLVLKSTSMSDSIEFALASVQLTGNELTLIPMEAIPQELDLGALDVINMAVDSAIINQLFIDGADPNAMVTLTIGGYKELTNVTFIVDGQASYSGEGNGRYRLGSIPEPTTPTLSLLALAALAARRKRC
ncbi:MAG: hypothetical protein MJ051_07495 [Akkermansia sp.]|nr:hypothetical protein [Akkermansia sp.]